MSRNISDAIQDASLDVLVPEDSNLDTSIYFKIDGCDGADPLSAVPRRKTLYFDEILNLFLILHTPCLDESTLKELRSRLCVALEIIATQSSHPGRQMVQQNERPANRDLLWTGPMNTTEEPVIVRGDPNAQGFTSRMLLIWKTQVHLSLHRARLQSSLITFKPSATLRSDASSDHISPKEYYLPSGVPSTVNLLESLTDEPGLKGVQPRLPALRLSRINTTSSRPSSNDRKIRIAPQPSYRGLSAITAKVRYSRANNVAGQPAITALLDVETGTSLNHDISLSAIDLQLSEGSAKDLGQGHAPQLPMLCRPKDSQTFLFRLVPSGTLAEGASSHSSSRSLDISIDVTVLESNACQPRIQMRWRTGVDFSTALNPDFGAPNQSMQRSKRPANIAMNQTVSTELGAAGAAQVGSESVAQTRGQAESVNELGVTITVTAPHEHYVGQPFGWDVLIVNRSNKARKLAVVAIPKRRRGDTKSHLPRLSTSSVSGRKDDSMADAVTDENWLFAMSRNASKETVQLVSLTNNVIIGPLQPGYCYNAELILLPLASGYLQIEALRIIDVMTNEAIDMRDLPDVMVYDRVAKSEESPLDYGP